MRQDPQHGSGVASSTSSCIGGYLPIGPATQDAVGNGGNINLVEAGHHQIGPGGMQQRRIPEARDAKANHASGPCGQDACRCVLDHQAAVRRSGQSFCGQHEEGGIRPNPMVWQAAFFTEVLKVDAV
jgi:hypothetical protein